MTGLMCGAIIFWMSMQCREHTCTGIVILCQNSRHYTMIYYYLANFSLSPEGRWGWAGGGKSWAFTMQLSLQCNIFSGAVVEGKSLWPHYFPYNVGVGAVKEGKLPLLFPMQGGGAVLCWGFTALFTQWGHLECCQFTIPNRTFIGQTLSSKWLTSIVHIFSPETDNCPSWMRRRENAVDTNLQITCPLHQTILEALSRVGVCVGGWGWGWGGGGSPCSIKLFLQNNQLSDFQNCFLNIVANNPRSLKVNPPNPWEGLILHLVPSSTDSTWCECPFAVCIKLILSWDLYPDLFLWRRKAYQLTTGYCPLFCQDEGLYQLMCFQHRVSAKPFLPYCAEAPACFVIFMTEVN